MRSPSQNGTLKLFDEPWSGEVIERLNHARPQAFTRIGPAVRHAAAGLSKRKVRHKLLLVLSDAEPQDEDGYEGQYTAWPIHAAPSTRRARRASGPTAWRWTRTYVMAKIAV